MNYKDVAKATQELLQNVNVPAGKQNARMLNKIHDLLDGLQDGTLVVGTPVKDAATPENAK